MMHWHISDELFEYYGWDENNGVLERVIYHHVGHIMVAKTKRRKPGARTDGRTDGRTGGRTDGRADGRTDGRTGGRTGGRTDGRAGGRAHGRTDDCTDSDNTNKRSSDSVSNVDDSSDA